VLNAVISELNFWLDFCAGTRVRALFIGGDNIGMSLGFKPFSNPKCILSTSEKFRIVSIFMSLVENTQNLLPLSLPPKTIQNSSDSSPHISHPELFLKNIFWRRQKSFRELFSISNRTLRF
jgi:hypothetical protein